MLVGICDVVVGVLIVLVWYVNGEFYLFCYVVCVGVFDDVEWLELLIVYLWVRLLFYVVLEWFMLLDVWLLNSSGKIDCVVLLILVNVVLVVVVEVVLLMLVGV